MNMERKGIKVNGKGLNNLRFADDIILLSNNWKELMQIAEELCKEYTIVGLDVNKDKTKIISSSQRKKIDKIIREKTKFCVLLCSAVGIVEFLPMFERKFTAFINGEFSLIDDITK